MAYLFLSFFIPLLISPIRVIIKPAQRGYFRSITKPHEETAAAGRERGMMGNRHDNIAP